ncbi:hypothetical protein [Geodermatophilus ruber]|uniref:Uncharacterized protein n=1 Tax=Geodermatophilus ruber TaxID=504800 RepID=A0A1I4KCP2_9ACTN|nr:hypothetical protein [Geodermatophilus ruber]SFL76554.1 hypothetical protein SAMN04488085_11754 [Geodermatophilus ruber]
MSAVAAGPLPAGGGGLRRIPGAVTGRTVCIATWLVVLALVGEPAWLAVLLALGLAGVWAAPLVVARRRPSGPAQAPGPPARPGP